MVVCPNELLSNHYWLRVRSDKGNNTLKTKVSENRAQATPKSQTLCLGGLTLPFQTLGKHSWFLIMLFDHTLEQKCQSLVHGGSQRSSPILLTFHLHETFFFFFFWKHEGKWWCAWWGQGGEGPFRTNLATYPQLQVILRKLASRYLPRAMARSCWH